ncbi:MAG: M48 family metalloprotease [Bdellovibrionales bacterium]
MMVISRCLRIVLCAIFVAQALLWPLAQAYAHSGDGPSLRFIRDAEIEQYIRELATPIWRAAGVEPSSMTVALVESGDVNAFVAEGMNEFFYTGLLLASETPEQLAGVIAHETGHVSGGHLIRGREAMRNASAEAILGMLIAVAAGAASGNGQAAAGVFSGAQHVAERSFLSFTRMQESSADAAGMSFLDKAGMTSRGMQEFFGKLQGQELMPTGRQDAYVRTHPLTMDRIEAVRHHVELSPLKDAKLDPKFYPLHERMKAKLLGYLQPQTALLRTTDNDKRLTARYARAIALYRTSQPDRALALVAGLLKEEPENPYFHELKAQIEFENGRIADSVQDYKKANALLPDSALLREAYGRALLESKDKGNLDLAIQQLQEADRLENHTPSVWRLLAAAWGRKAETTNDPRFAGMATYALAEEAAAQGKDKAAGQLAERAMKILQIGSPAWLRAQDIKLSSTPPDEEDAANEHKKREDKGR